MANLVENKFSSPLPPLNLNPKKPAYVIAVPRYHENLFQIIRDNHNWLAESTVKRINNENKESAVVRYTQSFSKKIIAGTEDEKKLEKLIMDLRLQKSEIFIDSSFHPKPLNQTIPEYIDEFLKNKGVLTYYTFRNHYRITVFPKECINFSVPEGRGKGSNDEKPQAPQQYQNTLNPLDQRQEYLIVPLYILLKRGKTYEQMKTLSYNEDGSYNVENVNSHHFYRVPEEEENEQEQEKEREEEMKEKVRVAFE